LEALPIGKVERKMTITTYQIRNVLKTYGNQLKRRASVAEDSVLPIQSSADLVDISIEARKRQVLSQLSNKLIAKVTSREQENRSFDAGLGESSNDQSALLKKSIARQGRKE
jgi:hypothetical protein